MNNFNNLTIILATNNEDKAKDFARLLPSSATILTMKQVGFLEDIEETGETFKENAALKLKALENYLVENERYKTYGKNIFLLADDSGISFDGLPGEYGVLTKRQVKESPKGWSVIIEEIEGKDRTARFTCSLAFKKLDNKLELIQSETVGIVSHELRGSNGFGFDPLFEIDGKTLAEMTDEEKDEVSPRRKAVDNFCTKLKAYTDIKSVNRQ